MSSYKPCSEHGHRTLHLEMEIPHSLGQLRDEPEGNWASRYLQSLQSSGMSQALPSPLGSGSWPCCPHGKGCRSWETSRQEPDPAQQVCTQLFTLGKLHIGLDQLVIGAWCLNFPQSCGCVPVEKCALCVLAAEVSPKRNAGQWLLQEHLSWAGAVYLTVRSETTDCNPGCVWGVSHKPPFGYLTFGQVCFFFSLLVQGI